MLGRCAWAARSTSPKTLIGSTLSSVSVLSQSLISSNRSVRSLTNVTVPLVYQSVGPTWQPIDGRSPPLHNRAEPPVMILHGLLGSSMNWRSIAANPRMSSDRTVLSVDLRNHGASPHSSVMTYDALSDDVITLAQKVSPNTPITLMGHSLGGRTAMAAVLKRPDLFDRIIVVDMSPAHYERHDGWHGVSSVVAAMRALDISNITTHSQANQALSSSIKDPVVRGFVLQNLVANPERQSNPLAAAYIWRIPLDTIESSMRTLNRFDFSVDGNGGGQHVKPFTKPACFIGGGSSDYITDAQFPVIRSFFPRSQIHIMPDTGHWVHAQRPASFLHIVRGFLDATAAGRGLYQKQIDEQDAKLNPL